MSDVRMIPTKINNKWELLLPEHRAARPEWPVWEYARLASINEHLGSHENIVYVGAEEGDLPALVLSFAPLSEMTLIEPNGRVFPNIKAIWGANGLPEPRVFVGFAGKESIGEMILHTGFGSDLFSGEVIGDHGFKELHDNKYLPVIAIDDIPMEKPITALMIDVEGSEWEVLRGAKRTLREDRPKIWLSGHPEFMMRYWDQYLGDLRNWVKAYGYEERLLAYEHEVHLLYLPIDETE